MRDGVSPLQMTATCEYLRRGEKQWIQMASLNSPRYLHTMAAISQDVQSSFIFVLSGENLRESWSEFKVEWLNVTGTGIPSANSKWEYGQDTQLSRQLPCATTFYDSTTKTQQIWVCGGANKTHIKGPGLNECEAINWTMT